MHFRDNILAYILIPLIILTSAASYYRFMVTHDHFVSYEGFCDPVTESCFVGCEDEECSVEYHYTLVERYAPDLLALCGDDITDCESADTCTPAEEDCSVIYCDPEIDIDMCDTEEETFFTLPNAELR